MFTRFINWIKLKLLLLTSYHAILVLAGNPMTCETSNCHLWLIQITPEQLAAFEAYREQEEPTEPWIFQGRVIANRERVHTPIKIEHNVHNGWRELRIPHTDGKITQWKKSMANTQLQEKVK